MEVTEYLRALADKLDQVEKKDDLDEFTRLLDVLIQALQDVKVKYETKTTINKFLTRREGK